MIKVFTTFVHYENVCMYDSGVKKTKLIHFSCLERSEMILPTVWFQNNVTLPRESFQNDAFME